MKSVLQSNLEKKKEEKKKNTLEPVLWDENKVTHGTKISTFWASMNQEYMERFTHIVIFQRLEKWKSVIQFRGSHWFV